MENKEKENAIYSFENKKSLDEYVKMFKAVPDFYWYYVKGVCLLQLVVILILKLFEDYSLGEMLLLFLVAVLIVLILYKVKIEWVAKKVYKAKEKYMPELTYIDIYEDYIIKRSDEIQVKSNFSEINKIYETDTNYYILCTKTLINIQKNQCNSDSIEFFNKLKENVLDKKNSNPPKNR